ncbi:phosphate transport system regulatory protein PhoU [Thalassobaculum fulvum]|jgi:phosphate transport system protein|uniref:Phosphate-specific transport system accessory protein PhoU n=1 Tax=Thalassobaculum fulvum TaxID=1633335 RepID=A0A919CMR0_9PROT|nr:phosphate signaling complex protein PhoU [Thalassobaculum fulvum]GHD39861.1 phosphate transport system regulatory protein PhoU [Thalassobaculum fulvum]
MADQHIVKQFDEELDEMRATIAQMGGMVEQQMTNAIMAISRRDEVMAKRCQEADSEIDAMEDKIEALTTRMLALRQPVALDLRAILAALKIAHNLERMGDYAKNVAKRASALAQLPEVGPVNGIVRMGRLTHGIIKDVLDAYAEPNVDKAVAAWTRDQEIDQMYNSLFRELLTYMMEDPRNITACAHLLFVAKNIERIGDHATNIAETVYFQEKGTRLEGLRPKSDRTSYAVVEPPEADEAI